MLNMDNITNKKRSRKNPRKTIAGIKLPPIKSSDGNVKTIVQVDPAYYSLVEGRHVRPNTSINLYKQNIKEVALKRTVRGYLVDEILRIDREIETERSIYETAFNHFREYQNSFDKFLADDNNQTIAIMRKSDILAKNLVNKTEEHKQANYEMASIKSKLQYIDESLMILLSFQNFLHNASPILWQEKHNITVNIIHSDIFCIDSDIFRVIDIYAIDDRLQKLSPPQLYFENSEQLLTVFNMLEKQNLNYLLVTEELNSEKNKFIKALDLFKIILHQELNYIQQKIRETEELIGLFEVREIQVKEVFYKILDKNIKYLLSSETALQIFNYIEFAFEQLIAPNDTKFSSLDMALALEREYDNLMLDISAFDLDVIKEIEHETYEKAAGDIKEAKKAEKLLKDVDKLNKRLTSSYEPSRRYIN